MRRCQILASAHRVFSVSTFSDLVLLLSLLFLIFLRASLHLSFGLHIISMSTHFHVLVTTSFSPFSSPWPNHLSLASLISHLCLPHRPLLLFLHSWSSQSSLFPSSISTFSSRFFLASFAQPLSVPRGQDYTEKHKLDSKQISNSTC